MSVGRSMPLALRADVGIERRPERVDLAGNVDRRVAVDAAGQGDVRRRRAVGGHRREAAVQVRQVHRVVRPHEAIGEIGTARSSLIAEPTSDGSAARDAAVASPAPAPATRRSRARRGLAFVRIGRFAPAVRTFARGLGARLALRSLGCTMSCRLKRPFSLSNTLAKKSLSVIAPTAIRSSGRASPDSRRCRCASSSSFFQRIVSVDVVRSRLRRPSTSRRPL